MAKGNGDGGLTNEAAPVEAQRMPWYRGLTGYHWLVLVVASLGWLFDTMDGFLFVLAKAPAMRELCARAGIAAADVPKYEGFVVTCWLIGWSAGGFIFGIVGDRWGRTRTMALTILIYAGFTGLSGLTQTWQQFAVCRFLTALGVGGEFAAGAALVAEVFPNHARPVALGIMQATSALGNIMAGVINLTVGVALGWRWVFGVGVLPALLTVFIRLMVKEPERWQQARAQAAMRRELGAVQHLFTDPLLRHHTLIGVALATTGVVGLWGIGFFSPELLRQALTQSNVPERTQVQYVSLATIGQNAGAFLGVLAWTQWARWLGRRSAFGVFFLGCLFVVPGTFYIVRSFPHALVMYPIMGFFTIALFGGYAVYFPELYPTRLRATGTGFCYNVGRIFAAAAPTVLGVLRSAFGGDIRPAAGIVSLIFLLGIFVLPFAPETKDKPLPE